MDDFVSRFRALVTGVLSGFDRLVFRGTLGRLFRPGGLSFFLRDAGIREVDFKAYALATTERIKEASLLEAKKLNRPVLYLDSAQTNKEQLARELLAKHPIKQGLVCIFTVVEPCMSFEYHRSANFDERGFKPRLRKCIHLYKYFQHPIFGFMNARIQTWFPFNVQICLNGREWLSQQLDRAGSKYKRADNCFTRLDDPELAQSLMNEQLDTNWPGALEAFARSLNPIHPEIFKASPMDYYWTAYQTEWATDVMFKEPRALAALYPLLVRHAVHHFKSPDVMRFLARKAHGNFIGEIVTSFKDRHEGVRVKHWVRGNSVKMYDKAGSILRVETTINQTTDFKVLRPPHDDSDGPLKWQPLRKGVADLHRRAQVSQQSNTAYLHALAAVDDSTPCAQLFDAVSRPVNDRGRRQRAMRLSDPDDIALLGAICRGEFAASGFRNRDLRVILHPVAKTASARDLHRVSAKTSRQLRLLRAHGIIRKIPKTHRYRLTTRGELLTTAIFATRTASIRELLPKAA